MDGCRNIRKYLSDFIEGSLEDGLKKRIEAHLESCVICQKEKELLEKSWALLEKWPSVEPPADFRVKFWQKVDNLDRSKRAIFPRPVYRRLAPVMASILFTIVLAGSIFIKTRIENINLAKDFELYQDFEIIRDMDLLVDLDFLAEQNEYEG